MNIITIIQWRYLLIKFILAAVLLSGLSGCTNISPDESKSYRVDRYSLIRSAAYTQRELLAIELSGVSSVTQQRHQLLVGSYCDLIAREAIYSPNQPNTCNSSDESNSNTFSSQCVATFHRCVKTCDLRSSDCRSCEVAATKCQTSNQSDGSTLSGGQ
ncbi:MAG TPA: hypothetical protein DCW94_04375 [Porticoccaceae bacterium]|nr:hypothetical protein [Porticoccaceae bacterium]